MKSDLGISFGLYKIDRSYIEELKKTDQHVPDCDYQDYGRAEKFYIGPFVDKQSHVSYFAPISSKVRDLTSSRHPPEMHGMLFNFKNSNMPKGKDHVKGCVDFRFAIPCEDTRLLSAYTPSPTSNQGVLSKRLTNLEGELKSISETTFINMRDKESYPVFHTSCDHDSLEDRMWSYIDTLDSLRTSRTQSKTRPVINIDTPDRSCENVRQFS